MQKWGTEAAIEVGDIERYKQVLWRTVRATLPGSSSSNKAKKPSQAKPKESKYDSKCPKYFSTELAGGCLRPATLPACHLAALPRCVVIECQQAQHGQSSLLCLCLFARLGAHLWVVVSAKNGTRRETNFSAPLPPTASLCPLAFTLGCTRSGNVVGNYSFMASGRFVFRIGFCV